MNIAELNQKFQSKTTQESLHWLLLDSGLKVSLACSCSREDMIIIDMIAKIKPEFELFFLDTGRLHEKTYEQLDSIRHTYSQSIIKVYFPQATAVQNLMESKGAFSFYESVENRRECCRIRKVEPLQRALEGLDAWITGMRQEHSSDRSKLQLFEDDTLHDVRFKFNPLFNWSETQMVTYIKENKLMVHPLHNQGYPSIGCEPCTRAIVDGEDMRAGRWWWENASTRECGLHGG